MTATHKQGRKKIRLLLLLPLSQPMILRLNRVAIERVRVVGRPIAPPSSDTNTSLVFLNSTRLDLVRAACLPLSSSSSHGSIAAAARAVPTSLEGGD